MAQSIYEENGYKKKDEHTGKRMGNFIFCSKSSLKFRQVTLRDDFESLVYSLVFMVEDKLPWYDHSISTEAQKEDVIKKKLKMTANEICTGKS